MIETPKPIHPYKKVTKRNAEQFFIDCMSVKSNRINWIIELAAAFGAEKEKLDLTVESLPILWGHVHQFVKWNSPAPLLITENQLTPEWFVLRYEMLTTRENIDGIRPKSGYDLFSLWLMDGLAYYFGEVFVKTHPHISWQSIVTDRYEMTCMPHIVSSEWRNFKFCTWQQVVTNFVGVWHPKFSFEVDGFNKAYDGMIKLGQM